MDFADVVLTIGFMFIPALMLFVVGSSWRAFFYSVGLLWLLMVVGSAYHLAYTPGYDSLALGIAVVAGWFPAASYAGFWVLIVKGVTEPANFKNG